MALEKYRRMRDFKKTKEPSGGATKGARGAKKPIFVIQEHHATRLHYDFRLEFQGVLKSWAVTKDARADGAGGEHGQADPAVRRAIRGQELLPRWCARHFARPGGAGGAGVAGHYPDQRRLAHLLVGS